MKKRIVLLFSLIGLLLVTIVSTSFALFTKSKAQDGINQITTYNCLDISIEGENELNLTNAYPIKDEEGILQAPYLFTIKNNCDHYVGVDLGVEYQEESTISPSEVKATLNKPSEGIIPRVLSNYTKIQATDSETGLPTETAKYIMVHEGLPAGDEQTFEYRMWIDYSVENLSPSDKLKVKIVAIGTVKTEEEAPKNWWSAEDGTLLTALRNNNSVRKTLTTPGNQINLESESVLAPAEDDYGTSYYYRGNVNNNYVVFNNMCWKIIRIDGNGNIKLILQNERGTSCEVSDYNYNYARYDGTNTTTAFNNVEGVYNTASGLGFMYGNAVPTGTTDVEKFFDAQANTTPSTILTRLQDWYDLKFTNNSIVDNLADVIWCGDKSLNSGVGYGNTYSNYGAFLRLITQKSPSLKCPTSDKINGDLRDLSKYTAQSSDGNGLLHREVEGVTKYYPIGLITADEAAFAGGVYALRNNTYYLYNGHYYWTTSPYCFFGSHANVWSVYSTGGLSVDYVTDGRGLRPAIALDKSATITSGDGTINNPYVIAN